MDRAEWLAPWPEEMSDHVQTLMNITSAGSAGTQNDSDEDAAPVSQKRRPQRRLKRQTRRGQRPLQKPLQFSGKSAGCAAGKSSASGMHLSERADGSKPVLLLRDLQDVNSQIVDDSECKELRGLGRGHDERRRIGRKK